MVVDHHAGWTEEVAELLTTIPSFAARKSSPPWFFGLTVFLLLSLRTLFVECADILRCRRHRFQKRSYQVKIAKVAIRGFFLEFIWCIHAICRHGLRRLLLLREFEEEEDIIAFYCGYGHIPGEQRPWHGDSLAQGIGGSEQCLIRLARALARSSKKRKVFVYNMCGRRRVVDGVFYVPTNEFDPWRKYTHLIVWRLPQFLLSRRLVMLIKNCKEQRTSFWVHDGSNLEMLRQGGCLLRSVVRAALGAADSIIMPSSEMVKAQYAALYGKCLQKSQQEVLGLYCIPHGVPRYFHVVPSQGRRPCWLLWPVSIERGLEILLRHIDALEAACPIDSDFRLFVCHHRNGYHDLTLPYLRSARNDRRIILTGMLPPARLAALYQACSLFVFPSSVPEAFSLAVWECMTHGVLPVVYGLGALQNIHRVGAIVVSPGDERALIQKTAALLNQPDKLSSARRNMLAKVPVETRDWSAVARLWENLIFDRGASLPSSFENDRIYREERKDDHAARDDEDRRNDAAFCVCEPRNEEWLQSLL